MFSLQIEHRAAGNRETIQWDRFEFRAKIVMLYSALINVYALVWYLCRFDYVWINFVIAINS